jgi:hypothetical protein
MPFALIESAAVPLLLPVLTNSTPSIWLAVVALAAVVALVAVAAFPLIEMAHVPDAPLPVVEGTDRFDRAVPASVAPVPPFATATVPVTFAALPVMLPEIFDPASAVIHDGFEYDPLVDTPSVMP